MRRRNTSLILGAALFAAVPVFADTANHNVVVSQQVFCAGDPPPKGKKKRKQPPPPPPRLAKFKTTDFYTYVLHKRLKAMPNGMTLYNTINQTSLTSFDDGDEGTSNTNSCVSVSGTFSVNNKMEMATLKGVTVSTKLWY